MSAVHLESNSAQQNKRSRSKPAPKPKRRRSTHVSYKEVDDSDSDIEADTNSGDINQDGDGEGGWYEIRGIIDEKKERGKIYYLVDWEGVDKNGRPHKPAWEPKKNVTIRAIKDWEAQKARNLACNPSHTKSNIANLPAQASNTKDRNLIPSSTNPKTPGNKEKPFKPQSTIGSGSDGEGARPRPRRSTRKNKLTPSHPPQPNPNRPVTRSTSAALANRNLGGLDLNILLGHGSSTKTRGDRRSEVVAELSNQTFDADEHLPEASFSSSLSQQPEGHQQSLQSNQPESQAEDHRTIPDSQGFSALSASGAHESFSNSQLSLRTRQAKREPSLESQQSRPSLLIPSRQLDNNFAGSGRSSAPALLVESGPVSVSDSTGLGGSLSFIGRDHAQSLKQEDIHASTSQSSNRTFTQQSKSTSDKRIEEVNTNQSQVSSNSNNVASEQSTYQAAQIVAPLNSQQGENLTGSYSGFTDFDDDLVEPNNELSDEQAQHSTQDLGLTLGRFGDNTRGTSSSKDHQSESELMTDHTGLSQSFLAESADAMEVDEPSIGQPVPTISDPASNLSLPSLPQVASSVASDQETPTRMTAKERIKAIRERNLEAIQQQDPFWGRTGTRDDSADANQADGSVIEAPTIPHADVQVAQPVDDHAQQFEAIENPPQPDFSPITPIGPAPMDAFTSSLVTANGPITTEHQSPAPEPEPEPEPAQVPPEQEQQSGIGLEEHDPAGIDYGVIEEQPTTLDPANLTLSIEQDIDISPSLVTHDPLHSNLQMTDEFVLPHEEEQEQEEENTPPNYPKSLLPYVPTGLNEFVVPLPFYNSVRPVYNDVLRENEGVIREYSSCFLELPHKQPHPTTIAKLDEALSRLFDVCDLPPFMETIPSMTPSEATKHVVGTNAKFAFVDELLTCLADVNSSKNILILARPGKVLDLLGHLVETKGYQYIRSGVEIIGPSASKYHFTVSISSTLENPASISGDADIVIAFDHTYQPDLLSPLLRERSPILLVLTNICSIQHLNMRVSENLEPLERKNVLVLALVKAMRYVEDSSIADIDQLHKAARIFADYIQEPDDDFDWDPQEVPEDVFEDLHAANSQAQPSQFLGTEQIPGSRKRSYETDEDEPSSKRARVSQPTVVTNVSHISDSLKNLIGDDSFHGSPKAALSVSVGKLETLSAKIASLESQLEESRERERQLRQLNRRAKKEADGYTATMNTLREKYMKAQQDRKAFEDDYYKAREESTAVDTVLESAKKEVEELKEKNSELRKQLSAASEALLTSANPELARMAQLERELEESRASIQHLEKKVTSTEGDMEYAKSAYQDASQRAGELQSENRALEQKVDELSRKADSNIVEVNRIHSANESKELLRMLNEQKAIVRDRDTELARVKDELRLMKESRRGTRQSSVPRSPRLSAFNSPRNGARGKGGSSSRGTSPAPPPTGVFEAGGNTPVHNNRASHLRETRF
ncbi:hypothetical protein M426DRAFT_118940 [Hypoxylon sp. CI-4A]|nr:hypothetical protein M426DRAFT_118940 [Hypoxylon sp. CI-4A]